MAKWAKYSETKRALTLEEDVDVSIVSRIVTEGYAADLTDDEVEKLGRDPFLIAYVFTYNKERCVVTTEVSRPARRRANRHIPDVCRQFNLNCCNTFDLLRALDFRTNWKSP